MPVVPALETQGDENERWVGWKCLKYFGTKS